MLEYSIIDLLTNRDFHFAQIPASGISAALRSAELVRAQFNLFILFIWQQIVKELINQPADPLKKDDRS
jgi:hypothetical protein